MNRKFIAAVVMVPLFMILAFFLSLCWGSYQLSIGEIFGVLQGEGTPMQNTAVLNIRLPRILVGMFVAGALAVSGSILQTMTKNDLAEDRKSVV